MCSIASLPASVVCHVGECIVDDNDPLHTMSQRWRTLGALASVCREMRTLIMVIAYPKLSRAYAGRIQDEPCPTIESIAFMDDTAVRELSTTLDMSSEKKRNTTRFDMVQAIICMAPMYWHLVPLRNELRLRRKVVITAAKARVQLRLCASDMLGIMLCDRNQRVRQEDAMDCCMKRFGSSAAFEKHDARLRIAAQKRASTNLLRAQRMECLGADMCVLARHYVDLNNAVHTYARTGCDHAKENAIRVFYQKGHEIDARKREMGPLPTAAHPTALIAYIAYMLHGEDTASKNVVAEYRRTEASLPPPICCILCCKNSAATACSLQACRACCKDPDCKCSTHRRRSCLSLHG